jgi:hypothetical protein
MDVSRPGVCVESIGNCSRFAPPLEDASVKLRSYLTNRAAVDPAVLPELGSKSVLIIGKRKQLLFASLSEPQKLKQHGPFQSFYHILTLAHFTI